MSLPNERRLHNRERDREMAASAMADCATMARRARTEGAATHRSWSWWVLSGSGLRRVERRAGRRRRTCCAGHSRGNPGVSAVLFELFQQSRDRFSLRLGQPTGNRHVVRGFDDDHDTDIGVEDGNSFGAVPSLEAAVKGSIRIGVHRFDPTSDLQSPVGVVRVLDMERHPSIGQQVPVLLSSAGVGEPGPGPSQANHMTLLCGLPSGRIVARWANSGRSSRSA